MLNSRFAGWAKGVQGRVVQTFKRQGIWQKTVCVIHTLISDVTQWISSRFARSLVYIRCLRNQGEMRRRLFQHASMKTTMNRLSCDEWLNGAEGRGGNPKTLEKSGLFKEM